jgi:methyltransferase (TIGR00027 family)
MKENRPSTTAHRVAIRRAAHQVLDEPKVLVDEVALRIIGGEAAAALQTEEARRDDPPLSRALRAFMAVRSRFAEDELARAIQQGARQYVILGAGLDTFAYRNPYPEDVLRVFEVDYPATQAWKRERLAAASIAVPGSLTFAAVDFESQTLAAGLAAAGFASDQRTFFSWLGVTPYLAPETVLATLRFIASLPQGSGVVFDYGLAPSSLSPAQRLVFDALARRVAAAGEPWQAFFEPAQLDRELRQMGFGEVDDLGEQEINARYFHGRADGLRVGSLAHLLSAWVGPLHPP